MIRLITWCSVLIFSFSQIAPAQSAMDIEAPLFRWLGTWDGKVIKVEFVNKQDEIKSNEYSQVRTIIKKTEDGFGIISSNYDYAYGSFDVFVGATFYIPEKEESHSLGRYGTELTTYPEKHTERKVLNYFNNSHKQIAEATWVSPDSLVGHSSFYNEEDELIYEIWGSSVRVRADRIIPLPNDNAGIGKHLFHTLKTIPAGAFMFSDQFIPLEKIHRIGHIDTLAISLRTRQRLSRFTELRRLQSTQFYKFSEDQARVIPIDWSAIAYVDHDIIYKESRTSFKLDLGIYSTEIPSYEVKLTARSGQETLQIVAHYVKLDGYYHLMHIDEGVVGH